MTFGDCARCSGESHGCHAVVDHHFALMETAEDNDILTVAGSDRHGNLAVAVFVELDKDTVVALLLVNGAGGYGEFFFVAFTYKIYLNRGSRYEASVIGKTESHRYVSGSRGSL